MSVRAKVGARGTIAQRDWPSHLVARPLLRQGNQGTGTLSASIVLSTLSLLFALDEYVRRTIVGAQGAGTTFGERVRAGHNFSPVAL
jgi:hypothetical protein